MLDKCWTISWMSGCYLWSGNCRTSTGQYEAEKHPASKQERQLSEVALWGSRREVLTHRCGRLWGRSANVPRAWQVLIKSVSADLSSTLQINQEKHRPILFRSNLAYTLPLASKPHMPAFSPLWPLRSEIRVILGHGIRLKILSCNDQ